MRVKMESHVFFVLMEPDCPIDELPWTPSRYLKSLRKTAGQLKLGVGFHYKVS